MDRQKHFCSFPWLFNPFSDLYRIVKHLGYALGSVRKGIQFYLDLTRIYLSSFFILSVCSVHCAGNGVGREKEACIRKQVLNFFNQPH